MPVHKRDIGMVFQSYALFPHLTVFANVAFGLAMRGIGQGGDGQARTGGAEICPPPGPAERYPAQLSGGQQQRVALARALVIRPTSSCLTSR